VVVARGIDTATLVDTGVASTGAPGEGAGMLGGGVATRADPVLRGELRSEPRRGTFDALTPLPDVCYTRLETEKTRLKTNVF